MSVSEIVSGLVGAGIGGTLGALVGQSLVQIPVPPAFKGILATMRVDVYDHGKTRMLYERLLEPIPEHPWVRPLVYTNLPESYGETFVLGFEDEGDPKRFNNFIDLIITICKNPLGEWRLYIYGGPAWNALEVWMDGRKLFDYPAEGLNKIIPLVGGGEIPFRVQAAPMPTGKYVITG